MKTLKLVGFVLLVEAVGAIGAVFTTPKIGTWYATLNKPSFSPPNWVFGPMWTILFALIGIALYLVWESDRGKNRTVAIRAFSAQMVLNVLWSALFFGAESPLLGLIDIVLLLVAIIWMMWSFYKISKTASWLLLPYLLWVTFAAVLNFAVWRLN